MAGPSVIPTITRPPSEVEESRRFCRRFVRAGGSEARGNHPGTIGIPPLRADNADSDGASVGMTRGAGTSGYRHPDQPFCHSDHNEAAE